MCCIFKNIQYLTLREPVAFSVAAVENSIANGNQQSEVDSLWPEFTPTLFVGVRSVVKGMLRVNLLDVGVSAEDRFFRGKLDV